MMLNVLHSEKMHPCQMQKPQLLSTTDYPCHVEILWMLDETRNDPHFLDTILFTDEAKFWRKSIVNKHNVHTCSIENFYTFLPQKVQQV